MKVLLASGSPVTVKTLLAAASRKLSDGTPDEELALILMDHLEKEGFAELIAGEHQGEYLGDRTPGIDLANKFACEGMLRVLKKVVEFGQNLSKKTFHAIFYHNNATVPKNVTEILRYVLSQTGSIEDAQLYWRAVVHR